MLRLSLHSLLRYLQAVPYLLHLLLAYAYDAWETSYAAGVLAASMSESGILGNVVGYEDDTIIANSNAFLAGAQTVNPNATVKRINAASFEDPAKGKEVGNQLIADGADVIFTDAARTSLGVIEAAQEASGDVFIIGDVITVCCYMLLFVQTRLI